MPKHNKFRSCRQTYGHRMQVRSTGEQPVLQKVQPNFNIHNTAWPPEILEPVEEPEVVWLPARVIWSLIESEPARMDNPLTAKPVQPLREPIIKESTKASWAWTHPA